MKRKAAPRYINPHVARAVAIAGSQNKLAAKIGVRQSHVWKWLGMKDVTPEAAIKIERGSDRIVTRTDLRPDLWPKVA